MTKGRPKAHNSTGINPLTTMGIVTSPISNSRYFASFGYELQEKLRLNSIH